jgi:hypothetical protein
MLFKDRYIIVKNIIILFFNIIIFFFNKEEKQIVEDDFAFIESYCGAPCSLSRFSACIIVFPM